MSDTIKPPAARPAPQPLFSMPEFPDGGLLPTTPQHVAANYRQQIVLEKKAIAEARAEAASRGEIVNKPCVETLHITLCFDGTNNHEPSDKSASPSTTSNIARLYHASLGGANDQLAHDNGFYSYYMQGVGTEFKEIGEFEPSDGGLKYAEGGENRINWGITRLLSVLQHTCYGNFLSNDDAYALVKKMAATWTLDAVGLQNSYTRRKEALAASLQALQAKVTEQAVKKTGPRILGLELYVYGFSRGAAEARAFATWLEALTKVQINGKTQYLFAGLPISIVFLGLFDTVATVGMAYLMPFAEGHMGWADDSMRLPDSEQFLQKCVHLVSAHEQRGCFPVDSIRRKANPNDPNGASTYRAGTYEYLYPGVHSDVGGGYPPGDQGKALNGPEELLSQVALHHMYDAAFKAGAPLQVPLAALSANQEMKWPWIVMDERTVHEFDISNYLIERFNTWRRQLVSGSPLEDALAREAELITAWRIHSFVYGQMKRKEFYQHLQTESKDVTDEEIDAFKILHHVQLKEDAARRENKPQANHFFCLHTQAKIEKAKDVKLKYEQRPPVSSEPVTFNTYKTYEPLLDKKQIENAAKEFVKDYNGDWNLPQLDEIWGSGTPVNAIFGGLVYMTNEQDEAEEYARMRTKGKERHDQLYNGINAPVDGEARRLTNLFDIQVHDSRAWFMNSAINEREIFTDYFRYRAVFFDNESSKRLSLLSTGVQVLGVAVAVASIGLSIKRHDPRFLLGLLVPSLAIPVMRGKVSLPSIQAVDSLTGLALPMLEGLDTLRSFTQETGLLSEMAKAMPPAPPLSEDNANTPELLEILAANTAYQRDKDKDDKKKALEKSRSSWAEKYGEKFKAVLS